MLHSTLPRAFLPPGLSYLGGYYGEDAHLYSATGYGPCIDDPYARMPEQRVRLGGWEVSARPISPCPLDLSLKPPQSLNPIGSAELEGETEDEEERRCREAPRRILPAKRSYSHCEEVASSCEEAESEIRGSPSVHSYHSYDDGPIHKDYLEHRSALQHTSLLPEENLRNPVINRYPTYNEALMKKEMPDYRDISHKSHPGQDSPSVSCLSESESYHTLSGQKELLLASPSHGLTHGLTHGYHQQLLLTPQHHLHAIHAPMTPPSTPSPPQCPRRRVREDPDITPSHLSATTPNSLPKQASAAGQSDKPTPRPKKKHARKLKFDEDTSSPVSGTVILGPDEAIVTGDIDPAFNIVEVNDEARAELEKIENRLGPYRCKLCTKLHDDAFKLAQHRCSRIAHVEYRCPECDKRFSCPANLASHRRWHKPRIPNGENLAGSGNAAATSNTSINTTNREREIACARCDAKFTRPAALRKHLATQHLETNNNVAITNNNNNNNSGDNNSGFDDSSMPGKTLCPPETMHLVNATLATEMP